MNFADQLHELGKTLREEFLSQRRRVRKSMAKARKDTHLAELEKAKNNPKQTWNIIGNIIPHKQQKKSSSYENPNEMEEAFNYFFANVGKHTYDEVMDERSKDPSGINDTKERKGLTEHTPVL